MTSFGPVAQCYDLLMKAVPYHMWAQYYRTVLATQGVIPRSILDVCCGTGIVTEIFAQDGYEMVGIDLSETMIQQARLKAKKKNLDISYEVADASIFHLGRKFDAAYSFFDSLNYITDPHRLEMAIQNVAAHLKPGGSFVFDMNTAYAYETKMFDQKDKGLGKNLQYEWKGEYDPKKMIIHVMMKFWYEGEIFYEEHIQRAYPKDQMIDYLQKAGFKDIRVYDSHTFSPPRSKSDRVHYAAILS